MMMPASFSVITENEMSYLEGGATVPETLVSNIVTLVANTFVSKLVNATLGALFSGSYKVGGVFGALGEIVTGGKDEEGNNKFDILNSVLQVVGLGAATYQLSTVSVPTYIKKKSPLYISGTTTNPLGE